MEILYVNTSSFYNKHVFGQIDEFSFLLQYDCKKVVCKVK